MSENFIKTPSSPALTKLVTETLDGSTGGYESMKEQLRQALSLPNPNTETAALPPTSTTQQEAPLSAPSSGSHIRVVYPSGNSRFEIYSDSEQGLDLQEQRIRALYGSQQ
jgi:hypothetical protein